MDIREMRNSLGITQSEFALRYGIPFRTVQNWETGSRIPPEYVVDLLEEKIKRDLINHKTASLPEYDPKKEDLPKRRDYIGNISWLKAIKDLLGEDVVFALDEALMCQGNFNGRNDEYLIWVYGDDSVLRFNGVIQLGNQISPQCVCEKEGLRFTNLNRTLSDALANESLLDMQGIIEATSKYYFSNNESFSGLSVAPIYQDRFDRLIDEAISYYND